MRKMHDEPRMYLRGFLVLAFAGAGCRSQVTVIARPGVPMLTTQSFTAPAGAVSTEIAKGRYVVNDGPTQIPAGATIIVLPSIRGVTSAPSN